MAIEYQNFRQDVASLLGKLATEHESFADTEMLVGSSDASAELRHSTVRKMIDSEWLDRIEAAMPYLDTAVRNPGLAIEDVDEILPIEISRHVSEQSIKHLARHTNLIREINGDEVTPSKLLNVFHEETYLTYENKFLNTLVNRLFYFVEKRYEALKGASGTEQNFFFKYDTSFSNLRESGKRDRAKISLQIELSAPQKKDLTEEDIRNNEIFAENLARAERIYAMVLSYTSGSFVTKMGKNFIRPPVIRTNGIIKNKNLKVCLELWEYIESYEKVGYAFSADEEVQMPTDEYIRDLYSTVALQYMEFYHGAVGDEQDNKILAERKLSEVTPDFKGEEAFEEDEDFEVYNSEYRKMMADGILGNQNRKLSDDEKAIKEAIAIALFAERFEEQFLKEEEERKRLLAEEEEARRRFEEAEKKRIEAEEAEKKRLAKEAADEARLAAEMRTIRRVSDEVARRRAKAEEQKRQLEAARRAKVAEEKRLKAEEEARRIAEEAKLERAAEEKRRAAAEKKRLLAEEDAKRRAELMKNEAERLAEQMRAFRRVHDEVAKRRAKEAALQRQEAEAKRKAAAAELKRIEAADARERAAEEKKRRALEKKRMAAEADARRKADLMKNEASRLAAEVEAIRLANEAAERRREIEAADEMLATVPIDALAAEVKEYLNITAGEFMVMSKKKKRQTLTELRQAKENAEGKGGNAK